MTIAALTADQIAGVVAACNAGIAANSWVMQRTRVKSELSQSPPVYTYGDPDMIESMKELVDYSNGTPAAVIAYLWVIDQRDPATNQPLPKGDPRWVYVSGVPVVNAPPVAIPADAVGLVATLATLGIYVEPNRLGVGTRPDPASLSALTIGGDSRAVIDGISNTKGTDGQNPGEVHKSSIVVSDNDGGMGWRQYLIWGKNGKQRNTLNRNASVIRLDSRGELCQSVEEVGQTSDGGQMWYVRFDWPTKTVRIQAFKVGWTITLARSSVYGAGDIDVLSGAVATPPAVGGAPGNFPVVDDPTPASPGPVDKTRVMPKDPTAQQFGHIQVEKLTIGGTALFPEQGTRYANGGLTIQGRADNSVEIRMKPGFKLTLPGVVNQIMQFASDLVTRYKRYTTTINMDSSGGEYVITDSTSSSNTDIMTAYLPVMGGKMNGDIDDGKQKYTFAYFQDGTHELYLSDGTRIQFVSVIEAFLSGDRTKIVARDKAGNPVKYK